MICEACGEAFEQRYRGRTPRFCSQRCRNRRFYARHRERLLREDEVKRRAAGMLEPGAKPRAMIERRCLRCSTFVPTYGTYTYCDDCRDAVKRARGRLLNIARRRRRADAVLSTAEVERMLAATTRCPLCSRKLVRGDHLSPAAPEFDHIVPIAMGGTNTRENLRILCRACNAGRPWDGSDLVGVQTAIWAAA